MKALGRIHWIIWACIVGLGVMGALFFVSDESPRRVADDFMTALEKQDVEKLTQLTYWGTHSEADVRASWTYTVGEASKYYRFMYEVEDESRPDANSANIKLLVYRNALYGQSTEEHYDLPMMKENGKWKVRAGGISREMYPFLPRI